MGGGLQVAQAKESGQEGDSPHGAEANCGTAAQAGGVV